MIGLFEGLTKYNSWSETGKRSLTKEEQAQISSAEVVEGQYGLSMCFMLVAGGKMYRKLSELSSLQEGDAVNVETVQMIELSAPGEDPIYRVDGELA